MNTRTNNLVQTWVQVTDESGRARLESRWIDASLVTTHTSSAA